MIWDCALRLQCLATKTQRRKEARRKRKEGLCASLTKVIHAEGTGIAEVRKVKENCALRLLWLATKT
jgi:hypothetical protein